VRRAIDFNEHRVSKLGTGEGCSSGLASRDGFLLRSAPGLCPAGLRHADRARRGAVRHLGVQL
jgi:hypothetical protein